MSFLDLFKLKKLDNRKIAYGLSHSLGYVTSESPTKKNLPPAEKKIVNDIIKRENHRGMTIAFEALEYLGESKTKTELIFALKILPSAGAGGSGTTIRYGEKLLSGDYIDDSNDPVFPYFKSSSSSNLSWVCSAVAQAYENHKDPKTALSYYKKACKLSNHLYIEEHTRCCCRIGAFNEAIEYLEKLKKRPLYLKKEIPNKWGDMEKNYMPQEVDKCLEDALKKQANNYIYRPRKSDVNPLSDMYTYCDK